MMELFVEVVQMAQNRYQISKKSFIIDVSQGSKYASACAQGSRLYFFVHLS